MGIGGKKTGSASVGQGMKLFKYWVSNLNTDEGQYAANGEELDRLVQRMILTGLEVQDIGIQVVEA
jgi:hypothetical protein